MLPSQSAGGSFIPTTVYEIPVRLESLHNLFIQYVSQGRYELNHYNVIIRTIDEDDRNMKEKRYHRECNLIGVS
jgi:hypothetical protein